ncbi:MAG: ABC transporter permease, partial [Candidatus Zixiibacteriota bacterium]
MSYETFIARRYLKSGRFFTSISTWITILGVTLGVAVVCFVMSMHNGFESEIRSRLLGTTSHITIFPMHEPLIENYIELVKRLENIEGVIAASPFIYYKAAISSAS